MPEVLAIEKPANCWQKNFDPNKEKNSLNFWSQKFGSFRAKTTSNVKQDVPLCF